MFSAVPAAGQDQASEMTRALGEAINAAPEVLPLRALPPFQHPPGEPASGALPHRRCSYALVPPYFMLFC